jgi:protein-L-isoaspartate(D-aspartate) O-methyltransferase
MGGHPAALLIHAWAFGAIRMDRAMLHRSRLLLLTILLAACQTLATSTPTTPVQSTSTPEAIQDPYLEARNRMVDTGVIGWGVTDPQVVAAMRTVPRHLFVPAEYLAQAYDNHPLPIGYGQTISQPYIVALMSQELGLESGERVLEIGTGSGYQAAVLAEMGMQVYSIEIIAELHSVVGERLEKAGYEGVQLRHADGYYGWEQAAPFDAIIVTAAPDHVPQPLLQQLKLGAVLVIPVGPVGGFQELWKIQRIAEDQYQTTSLGGVTFVPFVRE